MLTIAYTALDLPAVTDGVYTPQADSQLLVDVMEKTGLARGHRVADLCTGSGVAAIAACEHGGDGSPGAGPARRRAVGDKGGQAMSDDKARVVRVVPAGPVMVQGRCASRWTMAASWSPTGSWSRS